MRWRRLAVLPRAALAVLALVPLACAAGPTPDDSADPHGRYVEPQPLTSPPTACDTDTGAALLSAYFAALNAQDLARLAALFPNPGAWSFASSSAGGPFVSSRGGVEIRPAPAYRARAEQALAAGPVALQLLYPDAGTWQMTLTPSIDGALTAGLTSGSAVDAASPDQLSAFLDQVAGLHFTVRSQVGGRADWLEHQSPAGIVRVREIDLGGPFWRATGPRLRSHGRTLMTGGGKVAIYCEGFGMKRILLSPLGIH